GDRTRRRRWSCTETCSWKSGRRGGSGTASAWGRRRSRARWRSAWRREPRRAGASAPAPPAHRRRGWPRTRPSRCSAPDLAGAGTRRVEILRNRPSAPSRLPEPLRWDAKRPVETRGCVLPGDDHRQLRDGVVVVVPLHAREQLVVDVAARVRDRVGVFERDLLRVGEKRALRVVVEQHLELLRRDTVPAADGSIRVLSELATVPPGDATIEQRPERNRHALRLLLERGPH